MPSVESSVEVILVGMGAIGKGVVRHLHAVRNEASPFPKGMKVTLHSVIDYLKNDEERDGAEKFSFRIFSVGGNFF